MKNKILFILPLKALIISLFFMSAHTQFLGGNVAFAQDDWIDEFESLCSKTQHAMSMKQEELNDLVKRCDTLKPTIENLEGPKKKIYLRKLNMCRDLFQFVLQSLDSEEAP